MNDHTDADRIAALERACSFLLAYIANLLAKDRGGSVVEIAAGLAGLMNDQGRTLDFEQGAALLRIGDIAVYIAEAWEATEPLGMVPQ